VAEQTILDRRQGESDQEFLDRLHRMDTANWSVDDMTVRALLLREVRRRLVARSGGEPSCPDALRQLKAQIRSLSDQQRRQLAMWIALGMPA